ncbi:unnamed protein product [Effrenium voratum]|uniref:Uncharacterized protein n=1 Tax=Effrenium voratum TaxID=2562239 RepID=A0AA36IAA0_9DINO|nr:unnamed protein product [Effrenium voratum]
MPARATAPSAELSGFDALRAVRGESQSDCDCKAPSEPWPDTDDELWPEQALCPPRRMPMLMNLSMALEPGAAPTKDSEPPETAPTTPATSAESATSDLQTLSEGQLRKHHVNQAMRTGALALKKARAMLKPR